MPELPEVETIKQQVRSIFPLEIKELFCSDVINGIAHTPLQALQGRRLLRVERKGKMLIFKLDGYWYLLSHLGMTGSWRLSDTRPTEKHTHLVLSDGAKSLSYVDPRRFGHLYLLPQQQAQQKINQLGVDIASPEFNLGHLSYALKKNQTKPIKVALLDQKYFAGSGNYIANEICARAGIRPTRRCKSITKNEQQKILNATRVVLDGALKTQGTTFQGGYTDAFGQKGSGVQNLVVFYQKICQLCKKSPITKIMLQQRGTYYCPHCQK